MDTNYQTHIPQDFHPDSKVWIYQSSRLFSMNEAFELETIFNEFIGSWKSHGAAVKGYANLFFGQFIVIIADETQAGVGGCSIDSSVRIIKEVEQRFNVEMFNRQMLAFVRKEKVELLPLAHINHAFENGFINADTLYFNNLVQTKEELLSKWLIPVKDSWLKAKLPVTA